MKKILLLVPVIIFSFIAIAHEFWLQPRKFFYSVRETAHLHFLEGENFTGVNWSGSKLNLYQLLHYTPSGEALDLSRAPGNRGDSLQLPLQEEGTHMILFNSTHTFHHPDTGTINISSKTLIQVGYLISDACLMPTSLPLDIIPSENPYNTPVLTGREQVPRVKFRILFQGSPLPGVLVKIWSQPPGLLPKMDTARTDNKGWITVERHSGPCLMSCSYTERNKTGKIADQQQYQSSLCFEYPLLFGKSRIK